MNALERVREIGRRLFFRRGSGSKGELAPPLGEALQANWPAITTGPWHRFVQADWLGPYTPTRVAFWTLKLMREDPQLSLGLAAVKAPFFSIDYRVTGGNPRTRAFVRKTLTDSPLFGRLLGSILNAIDFGFQAHELIWGLANVMIEEDGPGGIKPELVPQAYVLASLGDIDPERVAEITIDEKGHLTGLLVDGTQRLLGEKLLHAVHQLEWRNWWGNPLLKRAYNPWYWCNWLYLYHMRYMEGKANPPYVGTAPFQSRYDEEKPREKQRPRNSVNVIAEQMASLRGGWAAALPWEPDEKGHNQWGISVLQDGGRVDQFITSINHMQGLKLRALCIPERIATQDTEVGSFAMVREHADIFLTILEGIKQHTVIPALNRIAELLTRYNFGRSAPVPVFEASELSRLRQELLAEIVKQALDVPLTLQDGREYTPAKLIDFQRALEALNVPLLHASDVATTPSPPKTPSPAPRPPEPRAPESPGAASSAA